MGGGHHQGPRERSQSGIIRPYVSPTHKKIGVALGAFCTFWVLYRTYHDGRARLVCATHPQ